jgi:hypothetical protein
VPRREGKAVLKQDNPPTGRQYLWGVGRRQQPEPAVRPLSQSKLRLAPQLLPHGVAAPPALPLPVTFANWSPQPAFCRFLPRTLRAPSVGTRAEEEQGLLAAGATRLEALARHWRAAPQRALTHGKHPLFHTLTLRAKGAQEPYDSSCQTPRSPNFGKPRLVINPRQAARSDPAQFFIAAHLHWQAPGTTRIRRHRWPGAGDHEEGQAEGLAPYPVRDFAPLSRHIALVAVT